MLFFVVLVSVAKTLVSQSLSKVSPTQLTITKPVKIQAEIPENDEVDEENTQEELAEVLVSVAKTLVSQSLSKVFLEVRANHLLAQLLFQIHLLQH
jgi:hypothetical protein